MINDGASVRLTVAGVANHFRVKCQNFSIKVIKTFRVQPKNKCLIIKYINIYIYV